MRQETAGAPLPLDLPVDRPRTARRPTRAARQQLGLGSALSRALRDWARRHDLRVYDVVLAAVVTVLARHTGQPQLGIGVDGAGWQQVDGARWQQLVVPVHDDPVFVDLIGRVRGVATPVSAAPSVMVGAMPSGDVSPYELCLDVHIGADEIELRACRLVDLFDADSVTRLLGHVATVLAAALDGSIDPISRLPLLSGGERRTMLVDWNDTATPLDRESCLHDLFAARAARQPDAPALVHGDRVMSFGEVNQAADQLAQYLRGRGVDRRVRVGICLDRGADLLVAILGVLKAGGAYVPLDADYPTERLEFMQADSECAVLITTAALLPRLPAPPGAVLLLDEHAQAIAAQPARCPEGGAESGDLCYVIYTSGSTGQPKGIALRHRGVVNNLLDLNSRFGVGPRDRVAALSSTSFDMSVYELLGITIAGGTVVIPRADRLRDPAHWQELIRTHRITVWNSAPALLELLLAHLGGRADAGVDTLRLAMLGGDWVAQTAPDRLRALAPDVRVIVMGGATESSIHSTIYEAGAPLPDWISIPYGRPMANQRTYILDAARQPVPVGVPGELHLAGVGLAEGYLGRPELTAERFSEWSHGPVTDRLYRTGDLAKFRSDGLIELLGRLDFQVKIRGLRIELGEVEAALREQPEVAEAVVVARRDSGGDNRLLGFVVPAAAVDVAVLRARLAERLPSYLVPAHLVELDRLPLSPNGKLDRARLTAMAPTTLTRTVRGRPPTDAVQRAIADVWCGLLEVDAVGTADSFGELGGHSLTAVRLIGQVRDRLGVEVSVSEVLGSADLADFAERVRRAGARPPVPPIVARARDERTPLSPAQRRLWYLSRLVPDSPVYHVSVAMDCPEDLDLERLADCLTRLVARHEALRTRFVDVAGEPFQTVAEPRQVRVEVEEVPADRLPGSVRAEATRPFDLAGGRLLRARVLRAGAASTLVLTTHHIVVDGWSLDVLFAELERLYAGAEVVGPVLRYTDFVAWQRDRLEKQAYAADLDYWRDRLAGAPPVLDLPGDFARPAVQSFRGGMLTFRWSGTLRRGLTEVSRRHGTTLFMTLFAGFAALLHRYGGQTDLVVGTPVAGRTRQELEPLVGFFVNILPLRIDLRGDPTYAELLARARAEALAGYEHQDVPFDLLVDELAPERGLAHTPVVQTLFQLNNVPMRAMTLAGGRVRPRLLDTGTAKFDIAVTMEESDDGLYGLFEYNGDIFREQTVRRLVDRLELLLRAVAEDTRVRLSELPLLPEAERHRILREWNDTSVPLPGVCVPELFDEQVHRRADAIAVECDGESLSYAELAARANRLARHLRQQGVRAQQRVGICMERSVELVVGLLGIVKAGAAYVPLDPDHPAERLSWIVADSGLEVLLSHGRTAGSVTAPGLREIVVDRDRATIAEHPAGPPEPVTGPGNLAYVIYTSGSTGRPKGVLVAHRAIVRLVHRPSYVSLGPGSRVAQASNASFDAYTFELWGALGNGGCAVILPKEVVVDPRALAEAIRVRRLTTMFLTTAAVNAVARLRPDAFAPLRELLFGGEAVEPRWIRAILRSGPPRRLVHVYGPTEATTFATCFNVPEVPERAVTLPIGRPISNTESLVLDARLRPVPTGFVGELYLGGPGLADGYLGRPGLTAERFVPHPFGQTPGERLYRTGDLVKLGSDGAVEFVGRLDDQVKIRGFRVEPGEIETALLKHEQIVDAAVLLSADEGEKRLVAFIVSAAPVDVAQVRARLRRELPDYMVPALYYAAEALPLSPNGKVDRRALAATQARQRRLGGTGAAPRDETEELLTRVWGELLTVDRVGIDDDFFELGGHSLLAVRLMARVNAALDTELPLRTLMANPNPRALAVEVTRARVGRVRANGAPLPPPRRPDTLPLSFAQQRLWFMDQLHPGTSLYNVPLVLRFQGRLNAAALRDAVRELVDRHEALRTRFPARGGRPEQVVMPAVDVPLAIVDLAGRSDAVEMAAKLAADEAGLPFDIAAGPLIRARLIRVRDDQHWMLLTVHHIVVDGAGLEVALRELAELYRARIQGVAAALPPPAVQAADHAVWQREQNASGQLDELLGYWRETIGVDPPDLVLPTDRPQPERRAFRGAVVTRSLAPDLAGRVRELGRAAGATPFMTLLAGFDALLARWSGARDITVGIPVAARTRPELAGLVGCVLNMVPVRVHLHGVEDFSTLLARVRQACLGAFAHQEFPFDKMVEALVTRRRRDFMPIFRVMFALIEAPTTWDFAGAESCDLEIGWPQDSSRFDLALEAADRHGGYELMLQYDSDLYDSTTAQALLAEYEGVLVRAVEAPQAAVLS